MLVIKVMKLLSVEGRLIPEYLNRETYLRDSTVILEETDGEG